MNKTYNDYLKDFLNSVKIRSKHPYYTCEEPLNKVAFNGKCSFFVPGYMVYDIKGYKSKVLINPTYKDVFDLCDDMIKETGNINNIFFKDIEIMTDYEDIFNNNIKDPLLINPYKVYNIEIIMEDMREAFDNYKMLNDIELY